MRKWARVAGICAAITLVAGGIAFAKSNGTPRRESAVDLVLYSETASFHFVDVGRQGSSIGDQQVLTDRLTTDPEKTHVVGLDRVIAESLPHNYVMVQLEYTIKGRGKITAAGSLNFGAAFDRHGDTLAITGGTGEFEHASGSVHLSVFDPETFFNELHFET